MSLEAKAVETFPKQIFTPDKKLMSFNTNDVQNMRRNGFKIGYRQALQDLLGKAKEKAIPCGEYSWTETTSTIANYDVPAILISDLETIIKEMGK